MASYSQSVLDEIRAAVDIVDVVNRFVNLKKAGQNWKGLCPFHTEKTPSFMVNEKKGIFHCFGCGVGGDAFGFLMRQDKLSFPEAVRALAKQAGVALPEERGPAGDHGREDLFRTMELAWRFYVDQLWKPAGDRAQQYLAERGIDPEVARRFGLGLAPEGWDALSSFMRSEKVTDDALVAAGLAIPREGRSGVYDRFRGRLLFAIRDLQGRVVAFGGRAFGDEQPKYLNSPETPLYVKGNLLYAADLARPAIQAKNRALLVEGYVDCLMAHQHGFTETVAALGTAFTPAQLGLLRRYCDDAILFFDADAAGSRPAGRAEAARRAPAGGPRPRHLSTNERRRRLRGADRGGAEPPLLRPRPRDHRPGGRHGSARADQRVRPRGADAGEGRRRPGGGAALARGRPEARRGRDAALD